MVWGSAWLRVYLLREARPAPSARPGCVPSGQSPLGPACTLPTSPVTPHTSPGPCPGSRSPDSAPHGLIVIPTKCPRVWLPSGGLPCQADSGPWAGWVILLTAGPPLDTCHVVGTRGGRGRIQFLPLGPAKAAPLHCDLTN